MFYRHYKGMHYKLLMTVRHSETLEELECYETLYHNDRGRWWVRPKAMFHETSTFNGTKQPRFKRLDIGVEHVSDLSGYCASNVLGNLNEFQVFFEKIFPDWDRKKLEDRLRSASQPQIWLASVDGELAGVKLGYLKPGSPPCREADSTFYSWVGGVLPKWRGGGVGRALAQKQIRDCRELGFGYVETKSTGQWPEMVALNLKLGFEVVGLEEHPVQNKILFRLKL